MNRTRLLGVAIMAVALLSSCNQKNKQEALAKADNFEKTSIQQGETQSLMDMKIPDQSREKIRLGDLIEKNKLTIIDFWASWCGPCRHEMPAMVSLYNDYKEKGLGIVGISLAEEFADWKNAIDELGLPWQQLSELRGWEETLAMKMNVKAIPHTLLLDRQGNILAEGLRSEELRQLISKKLDNPTE